MTRKHIGIGRAIAIFMLFLLFISNFSFAQSFTASTSSSTVTVGQQFRITFSVQGSNASNFKAPDFGGLNILQGPTQMFQTNSFNGNVSQTIEISYIVSAPKEGTFKVGAATIVSGGKNVQSNALTITATKSASGGKSADGGTDLSKSVFLRVSAGKSNVIMGEPVVVTYKLYTKVALLNYTIEKLPATDGFWSEEIKMPQQAEWRDENLDGVGYKVADLKKVVLFPQRSGSLKIEPMEGEVIARIQVKRQRSNDPFDQMFNDPFFGNPFGNMVQDVKVPLRSNGLNINVKDLPESGKPVDFNGAVGSFEMETEVTPKEVKANDALNVKIKISGKGNLKLIEAPKLNVPPEFEVYDPKISLNTNATSAGVSGSKTFEYVVIARNQGEFKISTEPFSWFSIENNSYRTKPAQEFVVNVLKGDGSSGQAYVGGSTNKEDVQLIGKDIRYIKTTTPIYVTSDTFFASNTFHVLLTAPALFFIGFLFVRRKKQMDDKDIAGMKNRRANSIAKKRLIKAKKLLEKNNKPLFLEELAKAIWGFTSDKLKLPTSELNKENIESKLAGGQVKADTISDFMKVLDACEYARFAPSGMSESNEELYKSGIEIISKLEQEIKWK